MEFENFRPSQSPPYANQLSNQNIRYFLTGVIFVCHMETCNIFEFYEGQIFLNFNKKMSTNPSVNVDDVFQQIGKVVDHTVPYVDGQGEEVDFNLRDIGLAGEFLIDLEKRHYTPKNTVRSHRVKAVLHH